ncbi:Bug family tripartite tricarboxylate transporter substrate binding protein [Ramlibacter sp.]|uniref:Bug family tripartite tricarboxylate transporter substrate binding protein n=1 Tax=Ramlibacter sp. TaxID=1917967 RepID=UPI003D0F8D82
MIDRRSLLLSVPGLATLGASSAFAQAWPDKPIRFIVPVAPGSATDGVARQVANALPKYIPGAQVVVDNRPGAGTVLGTDAVAKAPADGYTILFNLSSFYTAQFMEKVNFDAVADFEPIAKMTYTTLVMVTAPDSPYKTVADLVAAAKKAPKTIAFANAGDGTTSHMGGALLASLANIELVHAPYKNGSQAMIDVSSGQVGIGFSGPAALPLVKAGKLRIIATTGAKRTLEGIPDVRETKGLEQYEVGSPVWAFAPKGTPAAIVNRLSDAFGKIAATPEFKAFADAQQLAVDYQPAAAVKAASPGESAKWKRLVALTKT